MPNPPTGPDDAADDAQPDPAATTPARKRAAKKSAKKSTAKKAAKKSTAKKRTAKKKAKKAPKKSTPKKSAKKSTAKKPATAAAPAAEPSTDTQPPTAQATPPPAAGDAMASFPLSPAAVDRPWLDAYPPLVPPSYPYPEVPLTRLLDDAAKDFPDSIATDFYGRRTSYRQLHDDVDRFAAALQALGVRTGDRVGIALPNCPQHVVAFFAALRLGAVVVEHDPGADEDVLAFEINDAGCSVLVLLDPVYTRVENLKGRLRSIKHVVGTAVTDAMSPFAAAAYRWRHRRDDARTYRVPPAEGVLRYVELLRHHAPTVTQQPLVATEHTALLAYRWDSRDHRAVELTHHNLLANVFQVRLWIPDVQAGRETILCAAPFWEPYGLTTGLNLGMLSAATLVLAADTDPEALLTAVEKRKPTLFPAKAPMLEALAGAANARKHDLSSLRACLSDATPADDVVKTLEELTGGRVREGLGLAEASPMTHVTPVYGKAKRDRVGLPITDTVCALVDPDDPGRLARPGTVGRLAIHGPQVMKGYWQRPEETAATMANGWLLTDYLAEVDDEGYFAVRGRLSPT